MRERSKRNILVRNVNPESEGAPLGREIDGVVSGLQATKQSDVDQKRGWQVDMAPIGSVVAW